MKIVKFLKIFIKDPLKIFTLFISILTKVLKDPIKILKDLHLLKIFKLSEDLLKQIFTLGRNKNEEPFHIHWDKLLCSVYKGLEKIEKCDFDAFFK